jgi:hypothetical protein
MNLRDDAQAAIEVRRAEDMARRLDAFFDGDRLVDPYLATHAAAIAESAIERAAIAAEGAPATPAPGLVSTPTSDTRGVALHGITLATRSLLSAMAAVPLDPLRKRLNDLRKIIGASSRGHMAAPNGDGDDVVMVTYTYRDGVEWCPRHISACIKAAREWFRRQGVPFRYVWVAELQPARGILHYHAAYFVPRLHGPMQPGRGAVLQRHADGRVERATAPTFKLPLADDRGWWPHGMTRTELARDACAYLMSYLGKEDQKDFGRFPKGARAYGVGGLEEAFRRVNRWLRAPTFVRRLSSIDDGWKRAPAGGVMVDQASGRVAGYAGPTQPGQLVELHGGWIAPGGRHYVSEFRRVMVVGVAAVRRVAAHCMEGAMPEGVGPFSWVSRAKGAAA